MGSMNAERMMDKTRCECVYSFFLSESTNTVIHRFSYYPVGAYLRVGLVADRLIDHPFAHLLAVGGRVRRTRGQRDLKMSERGVCFQRNGRNTKLRWDEAKAHMRNILPTSVQKNAKNSGIADIKKRKREEQWRPHDWIHATYIKRRRNVRGGEIRILHVRAALRILNQVAEVHKAVEEDERVRDAADRATRGARVVEGLRGSDERNGSWERGRWEW